MAPNCLGELILNSLPAIFHISDLNKINERVHTLTMYIGPDRSTVLQDQILKLKPGRVIFNPGSENPTLQKLLLAAGIPVLEACTLVLLRNGKF